MYNSKFAMFTRNKFSSKVKPPAEDKNPVKTDTGRVMPHRELSVFWRIENFSVLGTAESPQFDLLHGSDARSPQHPQPSSANQHSLPVAIHLSDTVALCPTQPDKKRQAKEMQLTPLRVSFSVQLASGEHHKFHDKGLMKGLKVKSCNPSCRFLRENGSTYLTDDDSLTLMVKFLSDEPVFAVDRLFARTRVPVKKYSFEWKIDLSEDVGSDLEDEGPIDVRNVPCLPFKVKFRRTFGDWRSYAYMIGFETMWMVPDRFICEAFLRNDFGQRVVIGESVVVKSGIKCFTMTREFCEQHAKNAVWNQGTITLSFDFRTKSGAPVAEPFGETPFGYKEKPSEAPTSPQWNQPADKRSAKTGIDERTKCSGDSCSVEVQKTIEEPPEKRCAEKGIDVPEHAECTDKTCPTSVKKTGTIQRAEKCTNLNVDLISGLQNLYSQHIFSDFSLRVGDRTFPVHRNILSARSAVFRDVFEADVLGNSLELTDVDGDTTDRMLRYLYYDAFGDQGVLKLFAAASKYQIESLKWRCAESLAEGLSAENVCSALSLADDHSDQTLTASAKEFLFRNAEGVFRSEGWRRFMAENPKLASRLMHEKLLE